MRILIENSGYELRNMGDVAMLQVAVGRLQRAFPDAQLQVLTKDPQRLQRYCPGTLPLDAYGRNALLEARVSPVAWPARVARATQWGERGVRRRFLGVLRRRAARLAARQSETGRDRTLGQNQKAVNDFWRALREADVFIGTGGGYLTQAFEEHALSVCDGLLFSARHGKVTALMGQGIGPIKGRLLGAAAHQALSCLDLLTLREGVTGLPLCRKLGVPSERMMVTGDDAIELCRQLAVPTELVALGINVRVSGYSGVTPAQLIGLRQTLVGLSQELKAPLLGTPISTYEVESDSDSIARLLQGEHVLLDDGHTIASPAEAIAQIGRCRVVVTGSYHAGVFALSQGIPVVALAASSYYVDKFTGLAAQFEIGCHIIALDSRDWEGSLQNAVRGFWATDDSLSQSLEKAAHTQIQSSLDAYDRLFKIIRTHAKKSTGGQK